MVPQKVLKLLSLLKRTLFSTVKENENMNFGFLFTLLLGVAISYHWKTSALQKVSCEAWGQLVCGVTATVTPQLCWAVLARLEASRQQPKGKASLGI